MGYCHICPKHDPAPTTSQIKAGCGCLVFICNDCRDETNHVRHSKCVNCGGTIGYKHGETPDDLLADYPTLDEVDDDLGYDTFGPEVDERESEYEYEDILFHYTEF